VINRDFENWEERMSPWPVEADVPEVHLPRPGHADLVGAWKYGTTDIRDILERASARETAARVAGGALCRQFLSAMGVTVRSHVVRIGTVATPARSEPLVVADFDGVDADPVRCLDAEVSAQMVDHINVQRKANESIGGTFEVVVFGLVPAQRSVTAGTSRPARALKLMTKSSTPRSAATTAKRIAPVALRAE
jgi:chorismate synthase